MSIQVAPEIIKPTAANIELVEGDKLHISCTVSGNPKPSIAWTKGKESLQADVESGRIKLDSSEENNAFSLTIDNCLASDAGVYTLKAKNLVGEASCASQVTIFTLPRVVKPLGLASSSAPVVKSEVESGDILIGKISVNEKSQLKVECQIAGVPKPTITWFQSLDEIKPGGAFKIESKQDMYALSIKDCSNKEKGLYKVHAENSVGSVITQMYVDINNAPVVVECLTNTELVLEETCMC